MRRPIHTLVAIPIPVALMAFGAMPMASAAPSAHETATMQASQGAVTIMELDTLLFDPAEVLVAPGQEVVVVNAGYLQHALVVDAWSVDTGLLDNGEQASFTVPADVTPGTSVEFRCTSPGHTEAGQTGTLTVTAPDGPLPAAPASDAETSGAGSPSIADLGAIVAATVTGR